MKRYFLLFILISALGFGQNFPSKLSNAAINLTKDKVVYDPAYFVLKYPKKWGLKRPDTNIDHRRVPNLMVFFSRFGKVKPITNDAIDYVPGDIVTWDLPKNLTHIGIVVNKKSPDGKRYLISHNIGAGQVLQDCLFSWTITGHYQYQK